MFTYFNGRHQPGLNQAQTKIQGQVTPHGQQRPSTRRCVSRVYQRAGKPSVKQQVHCANAPAHEEVEELALSSRENVAELRGNPPSLPVFPLLFQVLA